MSLFNIAIVALAIAASLGAIVGYYAGFSQGVDEGIDAGFDLGASTILKKTIDIMERNGMFLSYCDALKGEARRKGMTESQIEELIDEQVKALESIRKNS